MLKNIRNLAISRQFLISLIFIALMFTAIGFDIENSYAADLNQSADDFGVELGVEDKLENSQNEEMLKSSLNDEEVLGATHTLNGGKFKDIQRVVDSASAGDTIRLSGTFTAQSSADVINVTKKLTITSDSTATLNGRNICKIFNIKTKATGTTLSNLVFNNGYSANDGGAVGVYAKTVTISNCVFNNNHAELSSGAVHTSYTPTVAEDMVVKNCKFTNNGAGNAAGALGAFGYNFKIYNCVFESNTVKNDRSNCYGGAVQVGMDTVKSYGVLRNCKFVNNKAISKSGTSHGGAGCVRNGTHYINCVFINNTADHGGALTFHASGGLENCQFYNNTANDYGGAVSISLELKTMNLDINDCIFDGNSAPLGGAVRLSGMNIKIMDSNFTDNYASKFGGAINIEAVNVTVSRSNFNENVANVNGGALYLNGVNTLVEQSSFIGNDAIPDVKKLNDGLGGAIYMNSTQAYIQNNVFKFNTARNGSAVYYDQSGSRFRLINNVMYQNQAWVYLLPVFAHDIYYGDVEEIKSVIHGGNNIAKYNNLAVSNAIYNAANNVNIDVDGETPVLGATMSGQLYQDDREYNMDVLLTVTHEDGSVVYNKTLSSSYLGEVSDELANLKPGLYQLKSTHFEDTYYKAITNTTYFRVIPKVDNMILKSSNDDEFNYDDIVVWTLNITNNGPNNATKVVVRDVLPHGVEYLRDTSGGKYDPETGVLTIGNLSVGQSITIQILTVIKTTGEIVNNANVTGDEYDINLTNNHDDASVLVNPAIDLEVTKTVNNSNPKYHDLVEWTVVVKNNGPDIAHDVKVHDVIPQSLIYVSSTGNYNRNRNYWNIGTMNPGNVVTLHMVCRVNATGVIENDASATGREFDRNMSNNFDDEKINVSPATDLAILKSVNASAVNYGDLVKWTLIIKNNGPDAATGVVVEDVLPDGFVYVDSVLGKGSYSNGRINVGSLAVGEEVTLNIICRVFATGTFVNVANVTGREYDWDLTNNKDNESVLVYPASDLEVKKLVNDSSPDYHNLVDWTVIVKNNGPDIAHDVKVYDVLPKSLIYVSSTGNYNRNGNYWNVGTLNVGSQVTLHIVTKVNATGSITNNVSVVGREYDFNSSNNFDDEKIDVDPSSDLAIVKSVNASAVNYGNLVKWTLVIKNNGPDAATGVVVEDVLPDGFTYVSSSMSKGSYSNGKFTIGSLAVGEQATINIICRVFATGTFVNVANVTGNEYDWDLTNNDDNESVLVYPASDLEVRKLVNNSNPDYHDLVDWTVVVKNNGPDVAHDVKVYDVLPKSLVYFSSTGNYNRNGNYWNVGTLNVGSQVILHIVTRVNATGEMENNVSVVGKEYDFNPSNNVDDELVGVNASCDLAIVKSVNVSAVNYGDLVKWTLTVKNNGPDAATGVYVVDALPDGFTYVSSSMSKGSYSNGKFTVGSLAVGEQATINIVCRVFATGTFVNVANVTGNEYDVDLTNNNDTESVLVYPASDLEVKKLVNDSSPDYRDLIDWTVFVKNNGPDVAHDVKVYDVLPKSLIYVSSTGNYNRNGNYWNVGTLNVGSQVTLHIVTRVNATGSITNDVSVVGREYDFNSSNNFDDEKVDVDPSSDLSVLKSVNVSAVNYGDLVKWTLTVKNNGPDAATGVYVVDVLPDGFSYVSSSMSKGSYSNGKFTVGSLAVGEQATINIVCRVFVTGTFVNVANVTGKEYDWDLTNNEDNESVLVYPASDLEVIKLVDNSTPNYGELVTWSIIVKNNGPDKATDVKVYDSLPKELVWQNDNSLGRYNHITGLWNIGELAKGNSVRLNIVCKVNSTGVITNIANVTAREYDYNLTNNEDNESIVVPPAADVFIEKLVNNSNPNYNDLVKWTLIISNKGPDKATDVYITENLPDGLILINYTASKGIYDNGAWAMCCLNKSEVQTLELICKVNKTGKITNIVSIQAKEYDPNPYNNEDNESIKVPPSVDLELIKEVDNENPDYGDTIMWTVMIRNNGPDNATGVVVDDILASDLIFVGYTSSKGVYSGNKWDVGTLNVGCVEYLNITCIINALGEIINYAEVRSNEYDWDESNNYDASFVEVSPVVDLAIEKLVDNPKPNYGDLVKWTLVVKNNGPNNASRVIVRDILPKGLTFIESSSDNYRNGIWNVGYLDAGESQELEILCKVSSTGYIVNEASVSGRETDLDWSNNYDYESINVPPASDLSITKVATKYNYALGEVVHYAIRIFNNGPDTASNVKVKDTMEDALTLKSFKASAGDFDEETKTWEIDSLGVGESESLLIGAVANKEGVAENHASASSDSYDPDLSNNEDSALVNISKNNSDVLKTPDVPEDIVDNKDCPDEIADSVLERNVSGHSIFILLISLLFSIVFLGSDISKRN